jgi:hypothetical protein
MARRTQPDRQVSDKFSFDGSEIQARFVLPVQINAVTKTYMWDCAVHGVAADQTVIATRDACSRQLRTLGWIASEKPTFRE